MTQDNAKGKRKPTYSIFWYEGDWVATSSEFQNISGCATTPKEALRELFIALACARKIK